MLDKLSAIIVVGGLAYLIYTVIWTLGRLEFRLLDQIAKLLGG